jgi:hypothetical protein
MSKVVKAATVSAATLAAAIALGALFAPPTARAGEFCSRDTDYVTDCSFTSMAQCEVARSGIGGDCYGNPSFKDNSIATIDRNAYAYSPLPSHGKRPKTIGR